MDRCPHLRRQLYRVVIGDGRTQLTERCLDCGRNPRPQAWVPKSEARGPVEDLPLLKDVRRQEAHQPSLFGDEQ